jgi:hypothetical protein
MKQIIKICLKRSFPSLASRYRTLRLHYRAYRSLICDDVSYLNTSGWMEGLKRGYPCRRDGSELPWLNFSVISFLEKRLSKELTLFEFGSGYSTLFYARAVNKVTSIEYDENWYEIIRKKLPDNAKLIRRKKDIDGDYCRSICDQSDELYDVVVVDGRDRVNCIKQSITKLSDRGVILLDDSQREKYSDGILYAKHKGYLTLDFEGLTSSGSVMNRTTIFYRRENCLSI